MSLLRMLGLVDEPKADKGACEIKVACEWPPGRVGIVFTATGGKVVETKLTGLAARKLAEQLSKAADQLALVAAADPGQEST